MYACIFIKVLSSAEISEKIFNLEHPQKNRYKDIHTCTDDIIGR